MLLGGQKVDTMPKKAEVTPDTVDAVRDFVAASFGSRFTTNLFRLFILAAFAIVVFYGRTLLNQLINENPTMVKNVAAIDKGVSDVEAVKSDENVIQAKLTQLSDSQSRVFEALKQTNASLQTIGTAQAVTNEHISGLEKTLERVENKQDAAALR
jgi:hypothetical protein